MIKLNSTNFANLVDYLSSSRLDIKTESELFRIDIRNININQSSKTNWVNFLRECENQSSDKDNKLLIFLNNAFITYPNETIKDCIDEISFELKLNEPILFSNINFERIIGEKSKIKPANFLELGLIASKCVVKINTEYGCGTGFLLKDNYILTNNHVLPNFEIVKSSYVQFNFEKDIYNKIKEFKVGLFSPEELFITNKSLDYSLIKLHGNFNSEFGFLEFDVNEILIGEEVNIIQHPKGKDKKIAIQNNFVVEKEDFIILYTTDTEEGSSGSPVFNNEWKVVGLHSGSNELEANKFINRGINFKAILKDIKSHNITI